MADSVVSIFTEANGKLRNNIWFCFLFQHTIYPAWEIKSIPDNPVSHKIMSWGYKIKFILF